MQTLQALTQKEEKSYNDVGKHIFNIHMYLSQQKPTLWLKEEVILAGESHSKYHLELTKQIEILKKDMEAMQSKFQDYQKKLAVSASEKYKLQQEIQILQDDELSFTQAAKMIEEKKEEGTMEKGEESSSQGTKAENEAS